MSIVLPFFRQTAVPPVDWNALYADHVGRIFNFFRYRVGNDDVAEDLTATTFEKAWKKRKQFKGDGDAFAAWLYAIARNVANDYFRKEPTLLSLEDLGLWDETTGVADEVAEKLEFLRLVTLIQQLPDRERDIITLKYGASLNNREIAHQLKISESNVGSILHRTIKKLRQQLEIDDESR